MDKKEKEIHLGMQVPKPKGPIGGKEFLQTVGSILNALVNLEIKTKNNQTAKITLSPKKLRIELPGGSSNDVSTENWRWAIPKKYNSATINAKNEIVIVGPGNDAIAQGAVAGMWICVQTPTLNGQPVLPVWPPTGLTENGALNNPDHALIYWWPLNLYCA